ncbi:MAG: rod shape-determining protein MreD [Paracoccaceae bacterium]
MVDPRSASLWAYRSLFLGLAFLIIFLRILPLSAVPGSWPLPDFLVSRLPDWLYPHDWPGADWLLCLTTAYLLRRPDYVPALAVAGVFFAEDLLAMRPPGLWALIVLVGTEFLRARENATRDLPFVWEWLMAGAVMSVMILVNWLVNALFLIPHVTFGPTLIHLLATVFFYPLLTGLIELGLGLRRAAKGEIDAFGQRL